MWGHYHHYHRCILLTSAIPRRASITTATFSPTSGICSMRSAWEHKDRPIYLQLVFRKAGACTWYSIRFVCACLKIPSIVEISPFCVDAGISNSISGMLMEHESDLMTCRFNSRESWQWNSYTHPFIWFHLITRSKGKRSQIHKIQIKKNRTWISPPKATSLLLSPQWSQ